MTDATGHMDWPGAGPDTKQIYMNGVPTDYYTHSNPKTGQVDLIKIDRTGKDTFVRDFPNEITAHEWVWAGNGR